MSPFSIFAGNSSIIWGQPYGGIFVPDGVAAKLDDRDRGQNTTNLCPKSDFDGLPIWNDDQIPSLDEMDVVRVARNFDHVRRSL